MNLPTRFHRPLASFLLCLLAVLSLPAPATAGGHAAASDSDRPTVLITGSNRGIGFEFVKQYADKGYRVIATCRNPDSAAELKALASQDDNILVERLDLLDLAGIDALAAKFEGQAIDVLINNGALMRGPDAGQSFGTMDYEEFDRFFHINVRGPLKVTEAFWPPHPSNTQRPLQTSLETLTT